MRMMFKDLFLPEKLGVRTKRIVGMIASEIQKLDAEADPEALAQAILKTAGLKIKSVEKGTDALFFMSLAQAKALAELAVNEPDTVKEPPSRDARKKAQDALRQYPGIDIAFFGRMVADDPSLNTDACAQVAHSISTHKVSNEYDYFTAVDDLSPDDTAGAGHIGTVEFNSATLYRYATVAVHELNNHLMDDTTDAVCKFIRAFACSMPTGKLNTFANRTLPDALFVTLRTDQPVNLVGAYERPVPPSDDGFLPTSAKRLVEHARNVYRDFACEPELSLVTGEPLSGLGDVMPFDKMLIRLADELDERLRNGGDAK